MARGPRAASPRSRLSAADAVRPIACCAAVAASPSRSQLSALVSYAVSPSLCIPPCLPPRIRGARCTLLRVLAYGRPMFPGVRRPPSAVSGYVAKGWRNLHGGSPYQFQVDPRDGIAHACPRDVRYVWVCAKCGSFCGGYSHLLPLRARPPQSVSVHSVISAIIRGRRCSCRHCACVVLPLVLVCSPTGWRLQSTRGLPYATDVSIVVGVVARLAYAESATRQFPLCHFVCVFDNADT